MDTLNRDDLTAMLAAEGDALLSMYLPTHRTGGPEFREDTTRFANLCRRAEQCLRDRGVKGLELQETLKFLHRIGDDALFWKNQSDGLAIFVGNGEQRIYRLPIRFQESCTVAPLFDIRQLLPAVQGDGRFRILAVSMNRVRLLEGSRYSVSEVENASLPKNLRDALNIDEYTDSVQFFSTKGADVGGGPRGQALFHGHGGSDMSTRKSDEIIQYFRRIDSALSEAIGPERLPLVFAGVDYLFPMFREASDYRELVEESVTGNPDDMRPEALHAAAWPLVESRFSQNRDRHWNRLASADPKLRGTEFDEVIEAAQAGRVETLFLSEDSLHLGDRPVGTKAAKERGCEMGADETFNRLVVETLRKGGTVFTQPAKAFPNGEKLIARYRFALEPAAQER